MKRVTAHLSALFFAVLLSRPSMGAGIVLEVPIPKTNIGGIGASGASLGAGQLIAPVDALAVPTIDGRTLPSVEARDVRTNAVNPVLPSRNPAGSVNPKRKPETGPAPQVGGEEFQKGLEKLQDGSGDIGALAGDKENGERGGEESSGLGKALFDGGQSVDGKNGGGGALPGSGKIFVRALTGYGVGRTELRILLETVGSRRSLRVADTLAATLEGQAGEKLKLTKPEKALLLVATSLQDTKSLDTDPRLASLFKQLGLGERGRGQLQALIKHAHVQPDAEALTTRYFGKELAPKWGTLGRLLARTERTVASQENYKRPRSIGEQTVGRARTESNPLLVSRVEHTGSRKIEGYSYGGRPLEYFDGGGSKLLFRHPNFESYLLTIFPKKSPQNLRRLTKTQRDAEILDAAMVSRQTHEGELEGRELLLPHKLAPPTPLKAGRMLLRDADGVEWNTSYLVQENIEGNTARFANAEELALVKALFGELIRLRIKVPEDVHIADNIKVGKTASDGTVRAYVIDAEGTKRVAAQGLLDRWMNKEDPLKKHYDKLFAQVRRDNMTRAANSRRP